VLSEKNRLIGAYRQFIGPTESLIEVRKEIEKEKREANATLNEILLGEFTDLGIRFEQVTWDRQKNEQGKSVRRPVSFQDVANLQPFHWGYEFDEILGEQGGFDVILTNPPWEVFKPQAKEFFAEHSNLVTKNIMTIKEFEKEQAKLLRNREVRESWLEYLSRFPHVSLYYRTSPQYSNQISLVDGKKAGTDVNLYKLFLERCFRLLREGGRCGILLPTGIYSDLGTKRLRETLFSEAEVDVLFGLSNERFLFEGVDHRFRICLLVFKRGGRTESLTAAFRMDPREAISADHLDAFLASPSEHITLNLSLIRRLSPRSLSLLEFKNATDFAVADKLFMAPLLGSESPGSRRVNLASEFHTTNDSYLFRTSPGPERLPLYEGKMIHQFISSRGEPKYWIDEGEARRALLGRQKDTGQILDYQKYRLGFRDVARSTDERTMIMTMLPRRVFCNHTLPTAVVRSVGDELDLRSSLFLCGVMNSFVVDYLLRQRVTTHLTFFLLLQVPVPHPEEATSAFKAIVERSARLICAEAEFADLWQAIFDIHGRWIPRPRIRPNGLPSKPSSTVSWPTSTV
jgi:Eco57I restriction-modification methylase